MECRMLVLEQLSQQGILRIYRLARTCKLWAFFFLEQYTRVQVKQLVQYYYAS